MLLEPMRLARGLQIKVCESVEGARKWFAEQAEGALCAPLLQSLAVFSNLSMLHSCGYSRQ
eukprot:1085686-Lingulodinium_polyedra.AAC.1